MFQQMWLNVIYIIYIYCIELNGRGYNACEVTVWFKGFLLETQASFCVQENCVGL